MISLSARQVLLFLVGGAFAVSVFLPTVVRAESNPAPCDINTKLDAFSQIKKEDYSSSRSKIELEFATRKDLLSAIIKCSLIESGDVKEKLSKLGSLKDETDRLAFAAYNAALDSFIGYYQNQESEFNFASTSPNKIKDLSQQILSWRESNYNQPIQKIVDFTLVFKQQDGISTASNRLKKIRSSLTSLFSIRNQEITNLLSDADKKISHSRELNDSALTALRASFLASPAAAFDPNSTTTPPLALSILPVSTTTPPLKPATLADSDISATTSSTDTSSSPRELIRDSYEDLKTAYEDFFQISTIVKKLLGF